MTKNKPSTNEVNGGRDPRGRFAKGNAGGPGNPFSKQVGKLRSALLQAIKPADVVAVVTSLVKAAKEGDTGAAKVLFDRLFGPPVASDIVARIEKLESNMEDK